MSKKSEQIAKILRETSTMKEAREKMIEEGLAITHAQARRHIHFLLDPSGKIILQDTNDKSEEIELLKKHNKLLTKAISALVDTLKLEAGLRISNRDEPGA